MNKQELAFEKLSKLKVGALFMEMGTGKTKVALDLINSKAHKVDYVLWICPFSIKNEIEAERLKWYPGIDLEIIGVESIGSSDRIYLEILEKCKNNKTFIVVDESLKIKNKEAKRTQRVLELGNYAEYRLILNGTPLSKNVLDLWTQMNFLSPKILNMSYEQFKNTYCEYYVRGKLKGLVKKQYNVEHLISLIKPYIFDCELEIESRKHYYDHTYSLVNKARYEEIKQDFISDLDNDLDFFTLTTLLQQHYCRGKKEKLEAIINTIKEPVIVFVKFLESIPGDALSINGSLSMKERQAAIEKFKTNGGVLYITYGCGAYGLNLQFCKNIIFAEHTFDYAQRIQAEARIYRIGQNEDVNYHNLWCEVGLERLIENSLKKKSRLLDEVKKEIDKKGVEEWLKSI